MEPRFLRKNMRVIEYLFADEKPHHLNNPSIGLRKRAMLTASRKNDPELFAH